MQKYNEAKQRLLREGIGSYLEAVTALIEYQREVQNRCRTVMEEYLEDYSSALGVHLKASEVRNCAWPAITKWEGDWWNLGVWISRKKFVKLRSWESSCCLQYESGENGLFCWIGECFPTTKIAMNLARKFERLDPKVLQDGREVWIEHKFKKVDEAITFDTFLHTLMKRWTGLWKRAGGIKEVLKSNKSGTYKAGED
jgi:hypothetical protein